jgi:hypothetical protein
MEELMTKPDLKAVVHEIHKQSQVAAQRLSRESLAELAAASLAAAEACSPALLRELQLLSLSELLARLRMAKAARGIRDPAELVEKAFHQLALQAIFDCRALREGDSRQEAMAIENLRRGMAQELFVNALRLQGE